MRFAKGKYLFAVICLLLATTGLLASEQSMVSYHLKVRIEPAQGSIAVRAKLAIPRDPASREIRFNLHETFNVRQLLVNGKKAEFTSQPAEFSPVLPAAKTIVIALPAGEAADPVQVDIEYNGKLKDLPEVNALPGQRKALDDQINPRMVELASYSAWYPQFAFGRPLQTALELSLPQGWIPICSGKKTDERVEKGRAITQWFSARDTDILVLASQEYRRREAHESGVTIEIYETRMPAGFIDHEAGQIAGVLGLYTKHLGATTVPADTVKHVYSPKRKGQGLAGIARPGMIVTSEGLTLESLAQDPKFSLFQGIAHEIGHFWWNFGAGQGDWVNEAFAEYYSAIAVQKFVSEEEYARVMAGYRNDMSQLPPDAPSLSKVPFMDGQINWLIRYHKGALMLDQFRHALGDEKFFAASREFFQTCKGHAIGTTEFRSFWKQKLGDQAQLVDTWLDAGGGMPRTK